MIYSGLNYRKLQERNVFSFDAFFSLNSVSGSGLFGFSGEGQTFDFKFQSGKVIDPEDRYVFSYQKDKSFNISGNSSGSFYDYYINKSLFCKNGVKSNFDVDNFYFNTSSGLTLDLNVLVNSEGDGDFVISGLPSVFYSGKPFSGKIIETGEGGHFDIFSGTVNSLGFVSGYKNVNITNLPISINGTGDIIFSGNFETSINKEFIFEIDFDTSLGKRTKTLTITGDKTIYKKSFNLIPMNESSFINSGGQVVSGDNYNSSKTGEYIFSQSLYIDSVAQTGLPFYVELNYVSGFTGNLSGVVTGSVLTSSGSGYLTDAVVIVSGINGVGVGAKAKGLPNTLGQITGFEILNAGTGYQSNPRFIVASNATKVTVTSPGSGYFSDPNFLISGAGEYLSSGFFSSDPSSGIILSSNFYNYGSGFVPDPSLTIYSVISDLNVVSGGFGYTGLVDLSFSGGNGYGASGFGLIDFRVYAINLTNSGAGYSSSPSVIFSGEELNKASGNAFVFNGFITGVQITNQGLYSNVPIVSFSGGGATTTGAGEALTTGKVTGSLIELRGHNYLTSPVVTINSNSGSGALITSVISSGASGVIVLSSGCSGSGTLGSYTKTFLNSFNLLTGINESLVDFNVNNYTGISGLSYKNEVLYFNDSQGKIDINIGFKSYYDDFPMVVLLNVSGYENNTQSKLITGIR